MMRTAIIDNGICINIIISETLVHPDNLLMIYSEDAEIGDLWDGTTFTKPELEVVAPAAPTKEELLAELAALTTKINALG
jgi:hypothetical protein